MHASALLLSLLVLGAPSKVLNQVELQSALQRFAVTPLTVDVSKLPASERKALARLVQAARVIGPLFLRQSWANNEAWLMKLAADSTSLARTQLQCFLLNKGPWDRLELDAPWLPG